MPQQVLQKNKWPDMGSAIPSGHCARLAHGPKPYITTGPMGKLAIGAAYELLSQISHYLRQSPNWQFEGRGQGDKLGLAVATRLGEDLQQMRLDRALCRAGLGSDLPG